MTIEEEKVNLSNCQCCFDGRIRTFRWNEDKTKLIYEEKAMEE